MLKERIGDVLFGSLNDETLVLFDGGVVKRLIAFRQTARNSPEQGGILLGYRRGSDLDVIGITTPMPGDKCSRYSFSRQDKGHERIARLAWRQSGGTIDYLGEWHTHPEKNPRPSPTDQIEKSKIIRANPHGMLFLILGLRTWHLTLDHVTFEYRQTD